MLAPELANLTLSPTELDACRPIRGEGGRALRAFCPFHRSDRQRSLRVSTDTGRFVCFACGAWGYTEEKRSERGAWRPAPSRPVPSPAPAPRPVGADMVEQLERYWAALPGSLGERYLRWRGIPLRMAQAFGIGYAAAGQWAHVDPGSGRSVRQWKYGRLVFPHTDPAGRLVNLYGRAVGADAVPKALRHDHLAGPKGYFNAPDLGRGDGPVYLCEGPFDALSLLAAGVSRAVAIFGVAGWRWEWARGARRLVFAFDADAAGGRWRELAWEAVLRGKEVAFVPPAALGGCKDVNEAWGKGVLDLGIGGHAGGVVAGSGGAVVELESR